MAKNDPRSQIPGPVLTPPGAPVVEYRPWPPLSSPTDLARASIGDLAGRAIASGADMAREYAEGAAKACLQADTNGAARATAKRLLRLALAHLET